jgi:hypothetical protein
MWGVSGPTLIAAHRHIVIFTYLLMMKTACEMGTFNLTMCVIHGTYVWCRHVHCREQRRPV